VPIKTRFNNTHKFQKNQLQAKESARFLSTANKKGTRRFTKTKRKFKELTFSQVGKADLRLRKAL
jgi:hypothetical protein